VIKEAQVHSKLQRITVQIVNWHNGDNTVRPPNGSASRPIWVSSGSGRTLRRETSTTSPTRSRNRNVSAVTATTCHGCRRPSRTTVAPGAGR